MLKRLFLSSLLIAGLSIISNAQTTRTVCTSGCDFPTIQQAVTAAASGDIILLNVNGAFTEKGIVLPEKNLTIKGLGKTTTILQSAATRGDAVNGGRLFNYPVPVTGGNRITFEDMTMRNAVALTGAPASTGYSTGGVFYANGQLKGLTVAFNRVKFYANETVTTAAANATTGGAAIYISATIGSGSSLPWSADLTLSDCDFDNNKTPTPSISTNLAEGACLWLAGSPNRLTINNCTFTNNSAYTRGGVMFITANWTTNIKNCLFENNTAANGDGGAMHTRSVADMKVENCLFKNNSAAPNGLAPTSAIYGAGGAVNCNGGLFRNCTFFGNSGMKGGGLCRSFNGSADELQIVNCTFSGNSASGTGRSIQYGINATANIIRLHLVNTIIANGSGAAPTEFHFVPPYTSLITNSKNYCNSVSTANASPGTTPTFDYSSSNVPSLGLSATLASNGGSLPSLALLAGSPMIDAGVTTMGATYDISAKDQRNYSRVDGGIDIGSFEYNGLADDAMPPTISHVALGNTLSTSDRIVTATIADDNGVYWFQRLQDLRPKLYFRKNNGGWNATTGTLASGTGLNGNWNFTISSAAMGGLTNNDRVYYYIVAQDVSTAASIVSAPLGIAASDVNTITTAPAPTSYLIGTTLPVKLEHFAVSKTGRDAFINWAVSDEHNLSHYEVERSTDGTQWQRIEKVTAAGKHTYSLMDRNLPGQQYFYRLRSVDNDASYSLSAVQQIRLGEGQRIRVYPNPVTGNTLTVTIEEAAMLKLYNSTGGQVRQQQLAAGTHMIDVKGLAKGTYYLSAGNQIQPLVIQ